MKSTNTNGQEPDERAKELYGTENAAETLAKEFEMKPKNAVRYIAQAKPVQKIETMECHYCGLPATSFDYFGSPCCSECGG